MEIILRVKKEDTTVCVMVCDCHGRTLIERQASLCLDKVLFYASVVIIEPHNDDATATPCQSAKSLTLVINLNAGHTRQSGFPFGIRDFLPLPSSRVSFFLIIF